MVKTNLVFPNSKEERKNNGKLSKEKKEGVVRLCCCLLFVVVVCCCCSLEHQSATTESIEILIKRAREREREIESKIRDPPTFENDTLNIKKNPKLYDG